MSETLTANSILGQLSEWASERASKWVSEWVFFVPSTAMSYGDGDLGYSLISRTSEARDSWARSKASGHTKLHKTMLYGKSCRDDTHIEQKTTLNFWTHTSCLFHLGSKYLSLITFMAVISLIVNIYMMLLLFSLFINAKIPWWTANGFVLCWSTLLLYLNLL